MCHTSTASPKGGWAHDVATTTMASNEDKSLSLFTIKFKCRSGLTELKLTVEPPLFWPLW